MNECVAELIVLIKVETRDFSRSGCSKLKYDLEYRRKYFSVTVRKAGQLHCIEEW